jgi:hypothetical protein
VPALKDINLFGPTVQDAMEKMGVLGFAEIDDDDSMSTLDDRAVAELDRQERKARRAEIEAFAALGAGTETETEERTSDDLDH